MSTMIDILLIVAVCGLSLWLINLKSKVRDLERENASKPPDLPSLSVNDLRNFQTAMAQLVEDVESYTESQLKKMKTQTKQLNNLCQSLQEKVKELEDPPLYNPSTTTRVVPLSTKQGIANHNEKDRILELFKKGWTLDQIAEELRITRGEVQLVVNLF